DSLPLVQQCFFVPAQAGADLETLLFRFRKQLEVSTPSVYFCSLSSRTIVYKGLLTPEQLPVFYPDLTNSEFESPFAIFHQRYSTNTQPSWRLAQPFRFVAHNGEINTISGNRRWMRAREPELRKQLGLSTDCLLLEPGMSDSASFDNAVEIGLRRGSSVAETISRLVPAAWEHDDRLATGLRNFLSASAPLQEPWDGPAALVFSDGLTVGAKLDRNGLRPMRYTLTSDGLLVVGSEVGITDLHDKHVVERQRLGPGDMLLADPENGVFFRPSEIFGLLQRRFAAASLPRPVVVPAEQTTPRGDNDANRTLAALGWTEDQFRMLFQPPVNEGHEALWSMGDDAPPAFISSMRRPLWDYCKQRFAQVTNPPIDPLRESHVMSLDVYLGERTMLTSPVVDRQQLDRLIERLGPVYRIDLTFAATERLQGAHQALDKLAEQG